jgi:hypothetical protein
MVQDEGVLDKEWYEDVYFLTDGYEEGPGELEYDADAFQLFYISCDSYVILSAWFVV